MAKIRIVGAYDSFAIVPKRAHSAAQKCLLRGWGDRVPAEGKQGIHRGLLAFEVVFKPPGSPKFTGLSSSTDFLSIKSTLPRRPSFSEDPREAPVEIFAMPRFAAVR